MQPAKIPQLFILAALFLAACASDDSPSFGQGGAAGAAGAAAAAGATTAVGAGGTAGSAGFGGQGAVSGGGSGGGGCDVTFCPASFGTPCCLPTGECGYSFGMTCSKTAPDAGPGGAGGVTASGDAGAGANGP